jgi:hypothetical protein
MLRARLPEIKSVSELMRVISALSKISENDLAAVCGVAPGVKQCKGAEPKGR